MRTPKRDVEWHGQKVAAGEAIMLCYASASRDEELMQDADVFRVDRKKSSSHLGFGYGPHLCLGRMLAKFEIECLFEELIPRFQSIEVAGSPSFIESTFVTGHKSLPIRYMLHEA